MAFISNARYTSEEMPEELDLHSGVRKWIAFLTPMLQRVEKHTWTGSDLDQSWDFLKRGVIKRQHEAIQALVKMADAKVGHFGVTLVRPAYEELIWIKYLKKNSALASELVVLLVRHEVANSLSAQDEFVGMRAMQELGFTRRYTKAFQAGQRGSEARLREIGRQLGWREGSLPTMAFLSRSLDRGREYRFLYQGTSRYVHFSVQEIFRRVWGQKGDVTIGSDRFSRYWQDFSMYWCFRLFIELLTACDDLLTEVDLPREKLEEFFAWIKSISLVPIITRTELEGWPESP